MKNELNVLFEIIKADYKSFMHNSPDMQERFNEGLRYEEGRKYIKVIIDKSVWGFIVNVHNDKKFAYGDVLKAAGWNAPARNKARCNMFDDVEVIAANVRWTGPNYL